MPAKLLLADDSVTIQRVIELTFADEDIQVIAVVQNSPSMLFVPTSGPHLADAVAVFTRAAAMTGQRAIIQSEADLPSSDRILFVKRTPHALVFPRCAAVVHHAGAGTTHTALKTGSISIPVPHVSDQFAWSDDLHRLGVAPAPLKRTRLNAKALASRIREAVGNARMKDNATAIQLRMANDDGPGTAARLVEHEAGHKN